MKHKTEIEILRWLGLLDVYLWILGVSTFFVFFEIFHLSIIEPYTQIGDNLVTILTFQFLIAIVLMCVIIGDWTALKEIKKD